MSRKAQQEGPFPDTDAYKTTEKRRCGCGCGAILKKNQQKYACRDCRNRALGIGRYKNIARELRRG
jgi:hypothetical protein